MLPGAVLDEQGPDVILLLGRVPLVADKWGTTNFPTNIIPTKIA